MRAGLGQLGNISRSRIGRLWPVQQGRWPLRRLVEAVLVLLLLVQGGRLIWLWLAPVPTAPVAQAIAPVDTAILTRFDAFFRDGGGAVDVGVDQSGLNLFGVQADGAGGGSAIIGMQDGRQLSVVVGEEVEPGLTLSSVAADHVVLTRGGASFRLDFPDMAGAGGAVSPAETPPAASVMAPTTTQTPEASLVDPQRLMAQAGLRPRLQGLSIKGLTVSASGNGAELRQAGLRSGDVILSVNGVALDSAQAVAALRSQLADAPSAQIQFERDGQVRSTTVRTRP